ncbi:MAG TPA: N-acetylmuramoyl-L-alanine amidase [Candidatus Limnocylindria bacterium]
MRRALSLAIAILAVIAAAVVVRGALVPTADATAVPPGAPLPLAVEQDPGDPDPDLNAPPVALAPPGGAVIQNGVVRIPKPKIDLNGQRRVGIQIGHLNTTDVPAEYGTRIQQQTGASVEGITEVDVTTPIAERMAALLRAQGIAVDILPTTVPEGYLADVFIALHADDDGTGELSGFKMAHSTRRSPYEDALMTTVKDTYAAATGLDYDASHVSRNMTGYYAFNWGRYQHATSPFTPSTIIELGFLSNDDDRGFMIDHADVVAGALVNGILAFLDATPRSKLFGQDLLVPRAPLRQGPVPSPTTPP